MSLHLCVFAVTAFSHFLLAQQPAPLWREPGLALDPAVSPDGQRIAYAADSDGSSALHIWIRKMEGGRAHRLTSGDLDDREPSFSPDGQHIAYASSGGISLVPAKGGSPRRLTAFGRRPRYSPDGGRIAFWSRDGVFVVKASGGEPRRIQPDIAAASHPIWSPDGKSLLFAGCRAPEAGCDWWISPPGEGKPIALGVSVKGTPEFWMAPQNVIVYSGQGEGKAGLWRLKLEQDPWRAAGAPEPVSDPSIESGGAALGPKGRIYYAAVTRNVDVWISPLDANKAFPTGPLQRLTTDPAIDQRPSLSTDGARIAWETSRGGNFEVRTKDLVSGKEYALTDGPLREHMPALSPSGSKVAFDTHDGDKVTVYISPFEGGPPVRLLEENVGQGSFQWNLAEDSLLYFHRAAPGSVGLLRVADQVRSVLLRHPKFNLSLSDARLSPDGQWIAFPVPFPGHRARLAIASATAGAIEQESQWTYLTPESGLISQPEWSPDGRQLYFLSDQSGSPEVWALPMGGGAAAGPPRLVLSFPHARVNLNGMRPRDTGLSIARDKLAIGATGYSGQLYSLSAGQ